MGYQRMTDDNGKDMKLEITQDKLVDLLMHSATRQDIADLRSEMNSDKSELKSEISGLRSELKEVKAELKAEMHELRSDMKSNNRMVLSILIVTILVPIALHFIK